jgi:nucleolar MIF4G domain-containing protein 1
MSQLAASHRMTTAARKALFSILLTSDDYLDAFEKIIKLNLKTREERDIVIVMFYCCLQVRRLSGRSGR